MYYDTFDELAIVLQIMDLKPLLKDSKFVFLLGEKNRKKYPINFRKRFNIDYSKMKKAPLRIDEMNTFYLNKFYGYSGTDFFQGVLNGSNDILVVNNWFFYTSLPDVIDRYVQLLKEPEQELAIDQLLDYLEQWKPDIKMTGFEAIYPVLRGILSQQKTLKVYQVFKALFAAMTVVSEKAEGTAYGDRITPIIFMIHTLISQHTTRSSSVLTIPIS